ncbi:hypothetical protein A0J61_01003 [Choanephora cucurbitarum]|uniref:Uncharacterized protein n=1 Tax=Choanephora cucurbitarum TaxID=101091 RepID=A0A1C7NPV4_9FUNG|nr:hypothetical protein A0J61_01003 [Choanephora cucurbitarum]
MFTAFGGIKKREPLFTFKRKAAFSPALNDVSTQINNLSYTPSSTVNTSIRFSSTASIVARKSNSLQKSPAPQAQKKPVVVEKEQEDTAIFDFPDKLEKNALEIKLMVAERRAVPDTKIPLVRKKSKSKSIKSNKMSPSPSCSSSSSTATTNSSPSNSPTVQKKSPSSNLKRKPSAKKQAKTALTNNNITPTNANVPMPAVSRPLANTCDESFDIFAFDPQPTSHLSHRRTVHKTTSHSRNQINAVEQQHTILPKPPTVPSHASTCNSEMDIDHLLNQPLNFDAMANLLSPSHFGDNSNFSDSYSYTSMPLSTTHYPITSFNNHTNYTTNTPLYGITQSTPSPNNGYQTTCATSTNACTYQTDVHNRPAEKKRKPNLVAHLKSANGEKEKKQIAQDFNFLFSDEDEEESEEAITSILPIREIINHAREKSPSPELSYEQKMERELEAMMQSEFGLKDSSTLSESEASSRPRYQPQNKVNVRVTFQKKKQ